jgi:3-hydroxy-3-methylglutaryl CoA synthase
MAVGSLTANGFPALLYSHPLKRDGEHENGLVLVDRGMHTRDRYVVWRWIDDPKFGIHYALGYYTDDFTKAVDDFMERSYLSDDDGYTRFIRS